MFPGLSHGQGNSCPNSQYSQYSQSSQYSCFRDEPWPGPGSPGPGSEGAGPGSGPGPQRDGQVRPQRRRRFLRRGHGGETQILPQIPPGSPQKSRPKSCPKSPLTAPNPPSQPQKSCPESQKPQGSIPGSTRSPPRWIFLWFLSPNPEILDLKRSKSPFPLKFLGFCAQNTPNPLFIPKILIFQLFRHLFPDFPPKILRFVLSIPLCHQKFPVFPTISPQISQDFLAQHTPNPLCHQEFPIFPTFHPKFLGFFCDFPTGRGRVPPG